MFWYVNFISIKLSPTKKEDLFPTTDPTLIWIHKTEAKHFQSLQSSHFRTHHFCSNNTDVSKIFNHLNSFEHIHFYLLFVLSFMFYFLKCELKHFRTWRLSLPWAEKEGDNNVTTEPFSLTWSFSSGSSTPDKLFHLTDRSKRKTIFLHDDA